MGAGRLDVTVHGGIRQSVARAYLHPAMTRPNLEMLTNTRALRIVTENGRARGVELGSGGERFTAAAAREIVVSLGTFESPKLLMLSGIGSAGELKAQGIAAVADVPGVGCNLQDHVNIPVQFALHNPALSCARWQRLDRALLLGLRYMLMRGGPGAGPFWSTCAFSSVDPASPLPDFQSFFTPMVVVEDLFAATNTGANRRWFDLDERGARYLSRGKRALAGFQLDINPMMPDSRGTVRLASLDALANPRIDPSMLATDGEMKFAVEAVKLARRLAAQPSLAALTRSEISPGPMIASDDDIRQSVRKLANTAHHPVGTCRMGGAGSSGTVVDPQLRVKGVERLRVVDASVMPRQIRGNPNSTIIAIAERASDLICGRTPLAPEFQP